MDHTQATHQTHLELSCLSIKNDMRLSLYPTHQHQNEHDRPDLIRPRVQTRCVTYVMWLSLLVWGSLCCEKRQKTQWGLGITRCRKMLRVFLFLIMLHNIKVAYWAFFLEKSVLCTDAAAVNTGTQKHLYEYNMLNKGYCIIYIFHILCMACHL